MPLFVVETIQTFRHKYVIDCENLEHAYDTVTMNEAEEFSQMYLGEQVVTGREITKKEFDKMVNNMKDGPGDGTSYQPESGSPWMGERLIHKVDYDALYQRDRAE